MIKSNLLDASAESELKSLADNIRIARKRRKLSRQNLANRVGVSTSTLVRLESGDPTIAIGTVFGVLSILGLLKGISELARPENDISQVLSEVRAINSHVKNRAKVFSDSELNF